MWASQWQFQYTRKNDSEANGKLCDKDLLAVIQVFALLREWSTPREGRQNSQSNVGMESLEERAGSNPRDSSLRHKRAQQISKGRESLFFVLCTGVTRCNEVSPFFLRNIYYWPSDFFTDLAWSMKDLLYGTKKKHWKNYLRICLFSSTEKEASYLQKCWRVSIFSFSSSIPIEKLQKILLSSRKIFLRKKTFVQLFGIWRNFIVWTK